jgi:hypothetical protein
MHWQTGIGEFFLRIAECKKKIALPTSEKQQILCNLKRHIAVFVYQADYLFQLSEV